MIKDNEIERSKLFDLFGRFSNIALFCMAIGAMSVAFWAVLIMGINGYQIGFTLIIFGYLLNWVLQDWEKKHDIDLTQKK